MSEARLDELLERYIDGRLTAEDKTVLEARLMESPEARQRFWARMNFEGLMEEAAELRGAHEWMAARPAEPAVEPRSRWAALLSWPWAGGLAAAAAAVAIIGLVLRGPDPAAARAEATTNGVALLSATWDARWKEPQGALAAGAILPPGRIAITAGVIGIEFFNGAHMTVEGPAEIELTRVDEAICHAGKIRVEVTGVTRTFRVLTSRLEVIDLGTEFALEVGGDAGTEVHVFNGKVSWAERGKPAAAAREELLAGQGIRLNPQGVARISARADDFVSATELDQRLQVQQTERQRVWATEAQRLRDDPRLVMYFDFERDPATPRILRNRANLTAAALDGVVVGCEWSESRWPGKGALGFRQPSDRVRVSVPGEFDALTYVAWLRLDRTEQVFTSIFLTDGFEPGEPHWQFYEGKVRLGIGDNAVRKPTVYLRPGVWLGPSGANYTTGPFAVGAGPARWRHLAVVMDTVKREVVHYLDGHATFRTEMVVPQKLRIGDAELGNWGLPASTDPLPVRNFNGSMDEFMIFKAPLSAEEILELYEKSRPDGGKPAAVAAK
ncbi:MAG: LamG-like jellyroll fold domain-containing protein [Opitutaceae bacterium]|nr:LamG-like jellyroll fold domain-containing protein [Opitutaceae bacterium]